MHATIPGERTLTGPDFIRPSELLGRDPTTLADLLASAEVTRSCAMPSDVVAMSSRVELVGVHAGRCQTHSVRHPGDAAPTTTDCSR